jgi:hypothetical protein
MTRTTRWRRRPQTAKSSKKGIATFAFLPYNNQGQGRYGLSIQKEGWFIRHYKIESRQLTNPSDFTGPSSRTTTTLRRPPCRIRFRR